jgi:hypothetical protein
MQQPTLVLALAAVVCGDLMAQSNSRNTGAMPAIQNGYNGALSSISSAQVQGRRGAAYPNGEMALAFQNNLYNPGSVPVEWRSSTTNPMSIDHPMFGFLVAREIGGRLVQISDWSYCKHAFVSTNSGAGCQSPPNGGAQLGVNCSDIYSSSNNGSRTYLGPPWEINPFTGVWTSVGSYFDIGDPAQAGYPAPADNVRSINTSVAGSDSVKNRVIIKETDIQGGVTSGLYFQIHVISQGEPIENRTNTGSYTNIGNTMLRPFTLTWNGTSWTGTATGSATFGTVLSGWTGATITTGQNGGGAWNNTFDGRFQIAVKVTGPVNGFWHYEYAVMNIDNAGGSMAFRLPVCPTARVQNIGFRDIDGNPLNDWTSSVSGGEIVWSAPGGNSQRWNQLFNFWFDSDTAPAAGNATIDQATLQPGAALSLTVPTQVPTLQTAIYLGDGCGTPSMTIAPNSVASVGNNAWGLAVQSAPSTPFVIVFSLPSPSFFITPGCEVFLNVLANGTVGNGITDGSGQGFVALPVNPAWAPVDANFQAASLIASPPVLGLFGLSNGLQVRFGGLGCQ